MLIIMTYFYSFLFHVYPLTIPIGYCHVFCSFLFHVHLFRNFSSRYACSGDRLIDLLSRMLGSGERYPSCSAEIPTFTGTGLWTYCQKEHVHKYRGHTWRSRSNHPVNPLHIVQVLLDLLANSDPWAWQCRLASWSTRLIGKARIVANVNAARSRDGAIRAEMRLEFEDLASIECCWRTHSIPGTLSTAGGGHL